MQLRKSIKTTLFEDFALRLPGPEHSLATIQFRAARGGTESLPRNVLGRAAVARNLQKALF